MAVVFFVSAHAVADTVPPNWESDYQGTQLELYDTGGPSSAPIGFDFDFYGESGFTNAYITANGYIGLGNHQVHNSDYAPEWPYYRWDERGSQIVSAMWTEFDPEGQGYDEDVFTYYKTLGSPGNRRFVVTWENTPDVDDNDNTFQIQLHESDNRIQMSYLSLPVDPPPISEHPTPVGVNFGDGVEHTSFNYNASDNGDGPDGSLEGATVWFEYDSQSEEYEYTSDHVPEPTTLVLLLAGLGAGAALRRRQS